jgi:hypothetical protein
MRYLRYGDIETRAQAVFQAAQNLALVLQRLSVLNVDFERQEADRHFPHHNLQKRIARILAGNAVAA